MLMPHLELLQQPVVEADGRCPALGRVQHISVGEATCKTHHTLHEANFTTCRPTKPTRPQRAPDCRYVWLQHQVAYQKGTPQIRPRHHT